MKSLTYWKIGKMEGNWKTCSDHAYELSFWRDVYKKKKLAQNEGWIYMNDRHIKWAENKLRLMETTIYILYI